MSLEEYVRKRDFLKTKEPKGAEPRATKAAVSKKRLRFVIQKHDASRLHYDFRLEMGGALKSWAVPKGLPYEKGEKHLAVEVEDHPLAYIDFEGTIPKGEYGGGTVMVWDTGTYEAMSPTPAKDLAQGKLHFILSGKKLQGEWYLVRLREGNQWLIIKGGEDQKPISKKQDDESVLSGKNQESLSRDDRAGTLASPKKPSRVKMPEFVEPMKAKLVSQAPSGDWCYEIKFDGWRALALKGGDHTQLLSRNQKELAVKFPEIAEAVAALKIEDGILDGEIVALDAEGRSSFQLLQAYDVGEERPPIFFYVFDLLQLNGENLRSLPLADRKKKLDRLLGKTAGALRYSASLGSDAEPLLTKAREWGLEGLIGKRIDSTYESGHRSGAWIKLKIVAEQEFVIGGYTDPTGTRKHFGALLVGIYKNGQLTYVSKVGTGFAGKILQSLHETFQKVKTQECPFVNLPEKAPKKWGQSITAAEMKRCHWVKPTLVCQVKFSEWTRDEHLRQPVFLGLRHDKKATEVIHEKAAHV